MQSDHNNAVIVCGKHGLVCIVMVLDTDHHQGRPGVMICCLLMHIKAVDTAEDSIRLYDAMRTINGHALTSPGQKRFVYYYEKVLNGEVNPDSGVKFELLRYTALVIIVTISVILDNYSLKLEDKLPYFIVYSSHRMVYNSRDACTMLTNDMSIEFRRFRTGGKPLVIDGDVYIEVYSGKVSDLRVVYDDI